MRKRILALGLDPAVVDLSQTPDLTPQLVAAFIEHEKLLNLVHERAPHARLCFNTTPADSTEAVRRWV